MAACGDGLPEFGVEQPAPPCPVGEALGSWMISSPLGSMELQKGQCGMENSRVLLTLHAPPNEPKEVYIERPLSPISQGFAIRLSAMFWPVEEGSQFGVSIGKQAADISSRSGLHVTQAAPTQEANSRARLWLYANPGQRVSVVVDNVQIATVPLSP